MKETLANIIERARQMHLHVTWYSPGDGKTRYRVFHDPENKKPDYFTSREIYTALGVSEIRAFLAGYAERHYLEV